MITQPENSRIRRGFDQGREEIVIPQPGGGPFRFLIGALLLFWLGGWAVGWKSAAARLWDGVKGPELFLFFWLALWTVGGLFAVLFVYRLFRPSVPERMVLSYASLIYDSGIAPLQLSFDLESQGQIWRRLLKRRVRTEFDLAQLKTLRLREFDSGNRLTIDQGGKRYDLAAGASEPEREWLFKILNDRYNP